MRLIDADVLTEIIEDTDWYHVGKCGLARGANSKDDIPLYKAEDIHKAIDATPTVPVLEEMERLKEQLFDANENVKYLKANLIAKCGELWAVRSDVAKEIFERLHAHRKYDGHTISVWLDDLENVAKEYGVDLEKHLENHDFQIGDKVYAGDWCYGEIVRLEDGVASIEFEMSGGGGTAMFKIKDLRKE